MADMTSTQGRYLAYIRAYTNGFGLPPAESEMAAAIGVSPPSVNQMMKTLEKKGLIRRQPGVARSIEILVADDAIPKWNGKHISRTVWEWTRSAPAKRNVVKKGTKKPPQLAHSGRFPLIDKQLHTKSKAELVAMMLAIAKEHAVVAKELEDRLAIEKPADLVVVDVSSAIDRATDFDERMLNRNFAVDWQAYAEVRKGLSLLVESGQLADAKRLALKLMKDGSYQVECSDEGLMTDEICQCLMPVIRAVQAAGGAQAVKWAGDMQAADRVKFICDQELAELRGGA